MTALAPVMEGFFTERLIGQRRASRHTIASYRDTFRLLLRFASVRHGKPPVKLTVELPAAVHRDLVAYAEILAQTSGQAMPPDPGKLIAPMLQRFMATDKGFTKEKRTTRR